MKRIGLGGYQTLVRQGDDFTSGCRSISCRDHHNIKSNGNSDSRSGPRNNGRRA